MAREGPWHTVRRSHDSRLRFCSGCSGSRVSPAPAAAQSQGLVVRDGTVGSGALEVGSGLDPNGDFAHYLIRADLGQQRGGNLFHSFRLFWHREAASAPPSRIRAPRIPARSTT